MVDKHSQSFFGQSTGLTVQSSSKAESHIFIKCTQRKPDGKWEKPSQGEGKTIKLQLDEIVMILEVLNKNCQSWSSYHSFNETKTQISVKWKDSEKNALYINIGKYSKLLNFAQSEILRLLLQHILDEKIEFATVPSDSKKSISKMKRDISNQKSTKNIPIVQETIENVGDKVEVSGLIENETQKALLIQFNGDKGIWIPKSCIHSKYEPLESAQMFLIDEWLLKKNNIIQA